MKLVTPYEFATKDVYSISRVVLDEQDGVRRLAPRDSSQRQEGYDSLFDSRTLICDVFWSEGGITLIAPPPLNLKEDLDVRLQLQGLEHHIFQAPCAYDRTFVSHAPVSTPVTAPAVLSLGDPTQAITVPVQSDESNRFANQHVMVTQQKDNDLDWIAYWVAFHNTIHGYESFLIYDNRSMDYSIDDLRRTVLEAAPGVNLALVDWNVPFGATGGPSQKWDSDYGQHAAWEHARRRFLSDAKSAVFVDVDELIVSEAGRKLTSRLEYERAPAFRLNRFDLTTNILAPTDLHRHRRHTDYVLRPRETVLMTAKPGVTPSNLPAEAQIKVHYVTNCEDDPLEDFVVRHFTGLRRDWRIGSRGFSAEDAYAFLKPGGDLVFDYALYRDFLKMRWR